MEEGYEELAFSAYISFYFEKGTGYGHSYNGRRQDRMRSVELLLLTTVFIPSSAKLQGQVTKGQLSAERLSKQMSL